MSKHPNELVVLLRGWLERAQKCRDEGMGRADEYGEGHKIERLFARAGTLEDCAKELEITMQHNAAGELQPPPKNEK